MHPLDNAHAKRTKKSSQLREQLTAVQFKVGVTGFEPATTRPPDAYSNRAELHPELRVQKYAFPLNLQTFTAFFVQKPQNPRLFAAFWGKKSNFAVFATTD